MKMHVLHFCAGRVKLVAIKTLLQNTSHLRLQLLLAVHLPSVIQ